MSSVPQPTIGVDDPDIRHWHARRVDSITEAREWTGSCHQRRLQEQGPNFAIVDPDNRLLGRVVLYTDLEGGTAEIGYWVLPDARGGRGAIEGLDPVHDGSRRGDAGHATPDAMGPR
jgi:RimJ/RimL family protein N-acetyltransferase